ncbi:acyl-CoA dehydrogenase family protein [Nocardia australiensis]|uniref:acyl-CoA dehydrogenase family protein n=1 Tax=Nocardia australiensis TaxID=2887191 RepID=UPI001D1333E7|nr:acyl-CoA dehydrogenase family protein [Nocardia australiensis]
MTAPDILLPGTAEQRRTWTQFFTELDTAHPAQAGPGLYERARIVLRDGPNRSNISTDRAATLTMLAAAAVSEPALFHVLAVHTCLIEPALTTAAAETGATLLQDFQRKLRDADWFGAMVITEAGAAASQLAVRTTATRAPNGFILDTPDDAAVKIMANAALDSPPRLGMVFAEILCDGRPQGVFAFAVPLQDNGIRTEPMLVHQGMPVDFARIRFDKVFVPDQAWLHGSARWEPGRGVCDPAGPGRLGSSLAPVANMWTATAVALAACARAAVTDTIRFASGRPVRSQHRFGGTLLDQPLVQHDLATATAFTATASVLARNLEYAAAPAPGPFHAEWAPFAGVDQHRAVTKAWIVDAVEQILRTCRIRQGSHGFCSPIPGWEALAAGYQAAAGDNTLILLDCARALTESTPHDDPRNDPHNPLRLLTTRVQRLATELAGLDPADTSWSTYAVELGRAHGDRLAANAITHAATRTPELAAAATLVTATLVDRHLAWYLTQGLLTTEQAHHLTTTLCRQIPHVLHATHPDPPSR